MANEEHLDILKQGVEVWNQWRKENPGVRPDLSGADLGEAYLHGANLSGANLIEAFLFEADLSGANLSRAYLYGANLEEANLRGANLIGATPNGANLVGANLRGADLRGADLVEADLSAANFSGTDLWRVDLRGADLNGADLSGAHLNEANLFRADLRGTDLTGADLSQASIVRTTLDGADLTGCRIYGISVWDIQGQPKKQTNLVITPEGAAEITVDDLETAQFIYLILNNEKIRNVIDTITSKAVLILGCFTLERKAVLDALRNALRAHNFAPIVFDFDKPTTRDFTETIMTLAGMCRFVIADITNPKSSPLELQATVPDYMIPFVPILQEGEHPFSMFRDIQNKYDWVLDTLVYDSKETLLKVVERAIIVPALEKHDELMLKKMQTLRTRDARDYLA